MDENRKKYGMPVRIDEETYRKLEKMKAKEYICMSKLVRRAVEFWEQEHKKVGKD